MNPLNVQQLSLIPHSFIFASKTARSPNWIGGGLCYIYLLQSCQSDCLNGWRYLVEFDALFRVFITLTFSHTLSKGGGVGNLCLKKMDTSRRCKGLFPSDQQDRSRVARANASKQPTIAYDRVRTCNRQSTSPSCSRVECEQSDHDSLGASNVRDVVCLWLGLDLGNMKRSLSNVANTNIFNGSKRQLQARLVSSVVPRSFTSQEYSRVFHANPVHLPVKSILAFFHANL